MAKRNAFILAIFYANKQLFSSGPALEGKVIFSGPICYIFSSVYGLLLASLSVASCMTAWVFAASASFSWILSLPLLMFTW